MKITIKLLAMGILLVLSMQTIVALGVTPGRTTINYPDDMQRTFGFTVLNSEHKEMTLDFRVDGGLKDYVTLEKTKYTFGAGEDSKRFEYTLNVPSNLQLDPGEHITQIIISESLDKTQSTFGAKIAVVTQVLFRVPYPDKYVEAGIDIRESDKNEITSFVIPVINRGSETVDQIFADVDIYRNDEIVSSVRSDSTSLNPQERKEIKADWKAEVPIGKYKAYISVFYDNITISYWEDFQVGELSVEIFDLFIEDFELGNIVKMDILVENKWGETLKEVYAQLVLYDEQAKKVVDVSTAPYDLEPGEKTRLPLYWDTYGLEEGEYNGKLIINYKDLTTERSLYVDISKYGIGLELASGGFVLEKENSFIKILIGLLIFIVVLFFVVSKLVSKK